MLNHRRYQVLATISIGLFIVSFAVIMTAMNRSVYEKCIEQASDKFYIEYVTKGYTTGTIQTSYNRELVGLELVLNYDSIGDDFCNYFKDQFKVPNNKLSEHNVEGLNAIKVYYRWSIWLCLFSLVGIVYSLFYLHKGRYYGPFLYGGLLGTFILTLQGLGLIISDNVVFSALRDMIFKEDYSFFKEDVLLWMIPPEYARWLACAYFVFGVGMAAIFMILRAITLYQSKPHKF